MTQPLWLVGLDLLLQSYIYIWWLCGKTIMNWCHMLEEPRGLQAALKNSPFKEWSLVICYGANFPDPPH